MKKLLSLLLLLILAVVGSLVVENHEVYSQTEPPIEQRIDFKRHFDDLGVNGSIIIYDLQSDRFYQHNPRRNNTAFLPASTYKIPNSLIALETGAIKDDVAVLTWDGIEKGLNGSPLKEWNQDLNIRLAYKYSAVWFYQVLARKIGHQRMQDFVNQIQYGNQNIGAEEYIDNFWLDGELRITPQQQIAFLRRLYQNDLPFSQKTIDLVKDIMIAEQTPDYILRAKTGWATSVTPNIGWYVGYLEQNDQVYFFATNLDLNSETDPAVRLEVTRLCLQDLGLL
ncbi:Beta-lactamase [Stanieria cyanosphaera PCC 7437]|uniref:beta-lactamase n=1 Tax=Stanieria cyanosphaera (strain ATCC 29371 / PCC 7437) TaxID=111780 RepID=K9Y0C9_STAC7|nr:class D beta-lactamase [Stanieria cyanosphaera]AFZ37397.1 Beta-lactamase [Stanieria cyanosphaera PCC 7437]